MSECMHDLQTNWLKSFVAVDAGSLSGAAPQVYRSQSAVSMEIKKLEFAAEGGCCAGGAERYVSAWPARDALSCATRALTR
jgi:hypothetical protein